MQLDFKAWDVPVCDFTNMSHTNDLKVLLSSYTVCRFFWDKFHEYKPTKGFWTLPIYYTTNIYCQNVFTGICFSTVVMTITMSHTNWPFWRNGTESNILE